MLRKFRDNVLVFGFAGKVHRFGGIVLLVVKFRRDDLVGFAVAPEREPPVFVADAVAHEPPAFGRGRVIADDDCIAAGIARVLTDGHLPHWRGA